MSPDEAAGFIRANTVQKTPPLLPEIALWLTDQITPLWQMTEDALAVTGMEPPFWAFAWPGGQAVARHVLDTPETVAGRRVLDICAGSGLCAIAAALGGASHVAAADLDPLAATAIALNAEAAGVNVSTTTDDLLAAPPGDWEVILAGDVSYERGLADAIYPWLRDAARAGALVLMGDPRRNYFNEQGLEHIADYVVPVLAEVESVAEKATAVWRVR
jgi:predicted nicotinamide N-methyase